MSSSAIVAAPCARLPAAASSAMSALYHPLIFNTTNVVTNVESAAARAAGGASTFCDGGDQSLGAVGEDQLRLVRLRAGDGAHAQPLQRFGLEARGIGEVQEDAVGPRFHGAKVRTA